MRTIKLWQAAVLALVVAGVAGAGVWFYQKHSQNVEAAALPDAARIQRVDGQVALCFLMADAVDGSGRAHGRTLRRD